MHEHAERQRIGPVPASRAPRRRRTQTGAHSTWRPSCAEFSFKYGGRRLRNDRDITIRRSTSTVLEEFSGREPAPREWTCRMAAAPCSCALHTRSNDMGDAARMTRRAFRSAAGAMSHNRSKGLTVPFHPYWRYLSRKLYLVGLFDVDCTFMHLMLLRHFKFNLCNGFPTITTFGNGRGRHFSTLTRFEIPLQNSNFKCLSKSRGMDVQPPSNSSTKYD